MSFSVYPTHKHSGVEWLGEIPGHWAVFIAKRMFGNVRESANADAEQLAATQAYGVIPQKDFMERNDTKVVLALSGTENFRAVKANDFVISLRSFQGGIEHSAYDGCVSPAYTVLRRKDEKNLNPGYFRYLLKDASYISALQSVTTGIREGRTITYEQFGSLSMPVAPVAEQTQIARFLDHETARIDSLIEEQQRLIELLKEKRQAVISHAVTKGLDPTVPMKDSGVEWLGEVPAHWALVPFGLAFEYQEGPGIMAVDFRDEGVPLVRISGVQGRWVTLEGCNYLEPSKVKEKWAHFRLDKGDLIISGSASMGLVSEVGEDAAGAVAYTGLIRLKPRANISIRDFIRSVVGSYQFHAQIDLLKAGSTIQHFGPTHLSQMKVVLPPVNEQAQIAAYVDTISVQFDELLGEAENTNALLQERRSALISAAVTGKIDVRGWQPPASAQAPESAVIEAV